MYLHLTAPIRWPVFLKLSNFLDNFGSPHASNARVARLNSRLKVNKTLNIDFARNSNY